MNERDSIAVMAYVDGELDPEAVPAVKALLKSDPEARREAQRLRSSRNRLADGFGDAGGGMVPPRLLYTVYSTPSPLDWAVAQRTGSRPWLGRIAGWLRFPLPAVQAVAVCLLLALGGGLGFLAAGVGGDILDHRRFERRLAAMDSLISAALFNLPSGQAMHGPADDEISVTPVRTFRGPSSQYCREYKRLLSGAADAPVVHGVACLDEKQHWTTRFEVVEGRRISDVFPSVDGDAAGF